MWRQSAGGGRIPDAQVIGDAGGARQYIDALLYSTGKVASSAPAPRGRQTFLVGCSTTALTLRSSAGGAMVQAKKS